MQTSTSRITFRGKDVAFKYPASDNLQVAIGDILGGHEYPILNFPDYQPKVVVDIGANVGATALYFYSAWPEADFHCYEPARDCYTCLAGNVADFGNIHTYPYGLYDSNREVTLFHGFEQPAQNSVVAYAGTTEQSETIKLVAADEEMTSRGIDEISVLKLDTEGCEVAILKNLGKRLGKIDLLYIEYHSEDDRREIDAILATDFLLLWGKAERIHTGLGLYISRTMAGRYPELEISKIERPNF